MAALMVALGGCGVDLERARGAEGLLDVVRMQGTRPGDLAAMAVDPYDPNARYVGTVRLAGAPWAGTQPFLALYEQNAKDEDAGVRSGALRGLAFHGEPRHVPLLIEKLSDDDRLVRIEAARALQRIHSPQAVDALLASLRVPDPGSPAGEPEAEVRAEAALALGQYAQPRVVEALIGALRDDSLAVNRGALESLKTLTGQDFGVDDAQWVAWRDATTDSSQMFSARGSYAYPVFRRSRKWWEHIPLTPQPPNEAPAAPTGMPRQDL